MNTEQAKEILKKVRQIEIRTNRLVNDSLAGQYHSVFKGRGMDFDEVREYMPGDEVRAIDWNVTARAGRPFIKKFTEERELTILLAQTGAVVAPTAALRRVRHRDRGRLVRLGVNLEPLVARVERRRRLGRGH